MLYQLLRQDNATHNSLEHIRAACDAPTPIEAIDLLASKESPSALERKPIFLIVDGLHNISGIYGESELFWILTQLGDLAQLGFILVYGTSTVSGPIDELLLGSRRRRISLPCSPLKPPTMNDQPVF